MADPKPRDVDDDMIAQALAEQRQREVNAAVARALDGMEGVYSGPMDLDPAAAARSVADFDEQTGGVGEEIGAVQMDGGLGEKQELDPMIAHQVDEHRGALPLGPSQYSDADMRAIAMYIASKRRGEMPR